ncbi:Mur ligase family protein [Parabacteroides sp. AM08-6]|uniref:Mur ligase family protein n=1 Tax=Parabacteroides sp. AM08-6 TaxID=2292053 RepID=UPI000F00C9DA|nr:Mur ligase family protein [Parabacteroides sp. AM08-6]RHJ82358.1 UDP-N-acetylmuramate--alanine ligase [Parabacteroides sp. AM08-6]
MRKVHLISVTEPLVYDLALALHQKGYEVSVSGDGLTDAVLAKLGEEGCSCYGNGWFPERLTKDIQFVVLGATVRQENPELIRAKELGLLVLSIPEFIFQRTKAKIRVVVAGSRGKKTIISMIVCALKRQKLAFDYALTSEIPLLSNRVHLSYEARIAIIEGDEHVTSALEKRFRLEFYRPHIAILTNLSWTPETDHASPEAYHSTFRNFASSIEREGKLIYFEGDPVVLQLAGEVREDITAMPYNQHEVIEKDGQTYLKTRYGDYPVYVPDRYFLINLNAARLACRQLGVKDADFYQALSEYSVSLQP